jgi:hypothetical protein
MPIRSKSTARSVLAGFALAALKVGGKGPLGNPSRWRRTRPHAATLEILGDSGSQSFALHAGMMAVTPQGTWHRFHSSKGVTLMTATPFPSEVIEVDVDDPRTVETRRN